MIKNKCMQHYRKCDSFCCKYVEIKQEPPYMSKDLKRWFYYRCIIHIKNKLFIPCRCAWLTDNRTCSIYKHRPDICKDYKCKLLGGKNDVLFKQL